MSIKGTLPKGIGRDLLRPIPLTKRKPAPKMDGGRLQPPASAKPASLPGADRTGARGR